MPEKPDELTALERFREEMRRPVPAGSDRNLRSRQDWYELSDGAIDELFRLAAALRAAHPPVRLLRETVEDVAARLEELAESSAIEDRPDWTAGSRASFSLAASKLRAALAAADSETAETDVGEHRRGGYSDRCWICSDDWPCDSAQLKTLREAVEAEWYNGNVAEDVRDRLLGDWAPT